MFNSPLVMEKAKQLAEYMEINFEPNNSWLQQWKESKNIVFQLIHGEKAAVDAAGAERWLQEELSKAVDGYEARNIHDFDESGLFNKSLLKGTLAVCGDLPIARKQQKECIMALFLCNQDGSDKQVFDVGKSAKPHCFSTIPLPSLPYYSNTKAWMLSSLWTQILAEYNRKLRVQNHKILLFTNNATCHKLEVKLMNIKTSSYNISYPASEPSNHQIRQPLLSPAATPNQLIAIDNGQS
uniref:DDE-1 domain-containing protein n=1 Tax=Plectus sambesii TaxID=2011161 RepID=A0A914WRP3_9BILA